MKTENQKSRKISITLTPVAKQREQQGKYKSTCCIFGPKDGVIGNNVTTITTQMVLHLTLTLFCLLTR